MPKSVKLNPVVAPDNRMGNRPLIRQGNQTTHRNRHSVRSGSQPLVGSTMIFSAVRSRVAYFSIVDGSSSSDTVP